jgi:hypothetical protein
VFETQNDLYTWITRADTEHLSDVDALSFSVKLDNDASLDEERENLQIALLALPKIRSLSLYKSIEDSHRPAYHALYDSILWKLGKLYPGLRSLAVHTDDHMLGFLRSLPRLQRLQFTGFSQSSPMETLEVLTHLRHMVDLQVTPTLGPARPDGAVLLRAPPAARHPCLTREVLRGLRGLRAMTLRESRAANPAAPAFFTGAFLRAMAGAPSARAGLVLLNVALDDFAPDDGEVQLLASFLAASRLRSLTIRWPGGVAGEILGALPRTVEELCFVGLSAASLAILAARKRAGQLPALEILTVTVAEEDREVRSSPPLLSLPRLAFRWASLTMLR